MTLDYAHGPDLSGWNEIEDWSLFHDDFVGVKASEGLAIMPTFAAYWRGAKINGTPRFAYHYFRPRVDAIAQADLFFGLIEADPGEIQPALDFEALDGIPPLEAARRALAFQDRLRTRTGRPAMLYTNYWLAEACASLFKPYDLWLTWPDGTPDVWPVTPRGWDKPPRFWQFSWTTGGLPGIADQTVDYNYFHGTAEELRAWMGGGALPPPPPGTALRMRVVQEGLRKRVAPDKGSTVVETLHAGDLVWAEDIGGVAAWVQDAEDGLWINVQDGDDRNMEPAE